MAYENNGRSGCWRPLGVIVLIIVGLAFVGNLIGDENSGAQNAGSGVEITRAEYGSDWPFSVESGRLYCEGPGSNVVMESGGVVYALNGRARGNVEEMGFVDSREEIVLTDDGGFYTVGNMPAIIERGLEMC